MRCKLRRTAQDKSERRDIPSRPQSISHGKKKTPVTNENKVGNTSRGWELSDRKKHLIRTDGNVLR